MKSATFEQVLLLASRRRAFYQYLTKDIHEALNIVGWKMEKEEMIKLKTFLSSSMAEYPQLTGNDLLNCMSWLLSDTVEGGKILSDNVGSLVYEPLPTGGPRLPEPPPAWIKIEPPPNMQASEMR